MHEEVLEVGLEVGLVQQVEGKYHGVASYVD